LAKLLVASLAFALLALQAAAQISVPELTGRVVDEAGILSQDGKSKVEAAIQRLESDTGGQMAVLAVKSLNGSDIESFSIKVAKKWKIGHKGKDDGAILVVSKDDRKIRLEIGYGWEGFVNDARAGDIIRAMGPYFRNGDFAGGMAFAVDSVSSFVTGKTPSALKKRPEKGVDIDLSLGGLLIGLFIVLFFIFVLHAILSRLGPGGDGTYHGGGFSSGGSGWGGGGFSGGGGSFGGGGASGSW